MASNYKQLGPYIKVVDIRNKQLEVETLLGVSVKKLFIPSIANTVGTDFKKYKIVKRNQFTYIPDTSRRGDKIGLAMLEDHDIALVSQAYTVFKINNHEELDPEYLMMWFRRPEFDRYARFKSHGSVREIFDWDEMCEVELPVPSIERQREIVKEYNTIVNRIKLNEQLNQKLEETAQAIYKHWFVDFEFPIDNNFSPEGEMSAGQRGYKSNGGEMVWNEELGKDVPKGWEVAPLQDFNLEVSDGNYSSKYPKSFEFLNEGIPFIRGTDFEQNCINPFNLNYISFDKHLKLLKGHTKEGDILLTTRGASIGKYAFISNNFIDVNINSQLVRLNGGKEYSQFFLGQLFSSQEFSEVLEGAITGSAQPQLSVTNLLLMKFLKPTELIVEKYTSQFNSIHFRYLLNFEEIIVMRKTLELVLSKMTKIEIDGVKGNEF